jgi:transposase
MPRYKEANYAQGQFIPIQFELQIMPGSFEHALSCVVDHKLDLTRFHACYHNDAGRAPAYDPRVMLKIVLCAYARGLISSRDIAAACGQNVVFMALSANSCPHFTTIAQFLREMGPAEQGAVSAPIKKSPTTRGGRINMGFFYRLVGRDNPLTNST